MALVYLSLGSNIEPDKYIRAALQALAAAFPGIKTSPVYESEAVGFEGDNFYNLVVQVDTGSTVAELSRFLRQLEDAHGRVRGGERFSARTLDIDILTYDDKVGVIDGIELPRREILKNAFVLLPLADIAPAARHPVANKTYRELWQAFDKSKQKLWMVELPDA